MCQWMMKVCLPWTHQDIRTIQRNTIHFQKETRSTLTRGQIYYQALEILGNRFEKMSENNKKQTKKIYYKKPIWRKRKKSQIDALDRFDLQFQNIRKEKKNKHLSRKISKGCLPKKNPRTYHSIPFLLLHSAGLILLTFLLISKK